MGRRLRDIASRLFVLTAALAAAGTALGQDGNPPGTYTTHPSYRTAPGQWAPPGAVPLGNPLGLPQGIFFPDEQHLYLTQRPDFGGWIPPARQANLRIPDGWVGFYNSTSQEAAFAVYVDGEKRPNVRLGPEEYITISCGRCDDGAWAAIATEASPLQPFKVKLASRSLLRVVLDGGQWKLIPSSLAMSISFPEPPGPPSPGIYVGAR